MNKVFKVIWSNARKCYVVVSEIAKNHGKNNTRSIVSQLAARCESVWDKLSLFTAHMPPPVGRPCETKVQQTDSEFHTQYNYSAAQWIVPLVLAGILLPASAWATDITRADSNVGVIDVKGGVYDVYVQQITTDKVAGINQFKKFSLDDGHIANMHFNQKGQTASVENLVNLVQERIEINGMVNAVKNGKIDGNLYFLSPNGMAVGSTGVINAGKFTALVPGNAYWFKLWDRPDNVAAAVKDDFAKFGTRETTGKKAGQFKSSGVELNADTDKDITIQGKINTRSGIVLGAGKIAIENGAVLKSQKDLDFNKLVNATAANLPSGNLNVTADKGGDIILRAETSYKYENSPLPIGTTIENGISNISEYVSALTHRNSNAEVTVSGEIAGDGNVDISAASSTSFTNKNWPGLAGVSDIGKEYLNRLGLNIDADVALKYNKASVAIENTGIVSAGGDARVQSDATVSIKMQSKTLGKKDPATAPGAGNPGQSGTSSALPVVAVTWADMENSALVDVAGDLSAGGDMKLAATTNTAVDLKAQATTEKAPDDPTPGNFAYVSVAVLSGDSVAEVKVDEPGEGNQAGKLKAGGDFSAEAATNSEIAVEAIASGTNDTLAATAFAVLDYDSAANVDLKRSVEGGSITVKADNEVSSLGISADNCAGEGADPFIAWKIKGDTNPGMVANWLKGKIGSGVRQGGSLQSFENAFSSALGYVTAGAAVGFVDNTNTANVTVAPGVELKATGDAVKKDSDGNPVQDEDGKPVAGGYVTLEAKTNMISFSHQVAGELNKQGTDAGQDSTVNVAAAALFSNIDNDATVELQSKEGKGATLISEKGDISLQAKVDSDDENTLSTLRLNDVTEVLDKFVEDLGKFGQDFSKFTKWKTEAVEIEKQQADGTISKEEASCRWYNAVAGIYDAIATLPQDYLRQSADAKKIITALNDLVSPASYTNYYVRSYAIDGQDSHGANYDIAGSFNIASQENKGIVAIGENTALTAGKNISIKAEGETEVISGTGNAGEFLAFSETNGTGAGASVAWQDISADGLVLVGKNVNLKAGSGEDKSEGDISLHAGAEVFEMGILYSAGKADRSEWNGTFSLQNGGGNSLVLVDDEAVLDAPGKVSLTALNDITVNNIAGSLVLGSSKSKFTVGAGVAVNWLETNSMAVIGDNGTETVTHKDGNTSIEYANQEQTDTDTKEFAKKSTEEQNKIISANTLAAARKLASDRGSVRKMDRDFEDTKTDVKYMLGGKTQAGAARGSVTATDIDVRARNDGSVNAVAVEGVSNSENHAGFDLINKVEKYGAQGKNDIFSFAQGVISTPENLLNKAGSKIKGKDWGWGGKSMFAERKRVFNPIPQNNDPADNGFNAALAGSLTLNRNNAGTAAVIDNTNLTLRKEDGSKGGALVTEATDDIFTGAWSGAAATNWFTGGAGVASNNAAHKGSLGAAVALNSLNRNVNAQISNAGITGAGLVDSSAIRNGAEAAAALGLAVTNDSQGTGNNGAVTFGLSVNKSTSGVHALLLDDTLTGGAGSDSETENGTDISIRTYDGDIQVAGGVDFSFANSADAGRAIAAGITATASEIKNDMRSGIQGGSYTGVKDITVAGEDALTQVNAAVGIGVTTSAHGFDAAGTLAVAELTNTNRAFISGADTIKATGDVSVTGRDISGTKDNPYKEYLEKRKEDPSGSSYLSEEAKQKLGADAGSAFVNVAVDIAGSKAAAMGAGVAVGNLTSRFTADITGNKKLAADSVKAAVHADTNAVTVAAGFSLSTEKWGGAGSFAFNDLVQEAVASVTGNRDGDDDSSGIKANAVSGTAKNDSDLLSITGDFAGAKGSSLGLGLAYNFLGNTTGVYVGDNVINAKDTARGVNVSLDANNNAYELALSVGAAVNNAEDNNFAAEGNFAVNRGHNDTIAVIGEDKNGKKGTYKDKISNASSVTVKATDATQRTTIAGDVDVAWKGSKVALGIGVAMTESERDSKNNDTTTNKERLRAEINNADITTVKKNVQGASISAESKDTSRATTVAAGVGITKQSYLGAQGIGADANILKTNTAGLHDTTVDKNDTEKGALVNVKATTASTIKTGAAALQVSGENTYVTGVVAVGVNRIKDDTAAEVTYTDKQDARSMNAGNLDISAASQADILSVAAGATGTWKGSAAIGGSGSHNYIANNVAAKIENADISSTGNAGVVASSDEAISNYAGLLDVALQGSALSASIGVTGSNNEISGTTEALIKNSTVAAKGSESNKIKVNDGLKANDEDNNYMIDSSVSMKTWSAGSFTEGEGDTKKYGVSRLQKGRKEAEKSGVVVDASATHSISSAMANGGVAVNMGGGGGAGGGIAGSIAGVVNLNEVSGATTAKVLDSQINSADRRSDVTVHAADYTNVAEFSGSAAIGVGQNVGAGVGFTGSTNRIDRVTAAGVSTSKAVWNDEAKRYEINDSSKTLNTIYAKDFSVTADAKQAMSSFNVTAGIAGSSTVAVETGDNVSTSSLESSTIATVTNTTLHYKDKAKVEATHGDAVYNLNIDAGAAIAPTQQGVAASLNVGVGVADEASAVTADVANSELKSDAENNEENGNKTELTVGAKNSTKLEATLVSAGVAVSPFSGGIAASVAVNNIETKVTSRIAGSTLTADTITINTENELTVKDRTGTGAGALMAGIGVGVDVNTFNDAVSTIIDNSTLKAKDKLAVTTETRREIDSTAAGVAIGGAEIGVNVLAVTVNSGLGDTEDVKDEEKNSGTFSHKDAVNKTLEKINEIAANDLSEHFYGMTDEEKGKMKERMKTVAKNGDGITGAGVHTYVRGKSVVEAAAGDVTVFNNEYNDALLNGGTGGLGGLAVNVTDTLFHLNQQNDIDVDNSTITGKNVALVAQQANRQDKDEAVSVRTTQASAGVVGIGVGYAGIVTKGSTGVSVNTGTIKATDGDLTLKSTDTVKSRAYMLGVQPLSGVGVQVCVANNEDKADNYVTVESGSSLTAERIVKTETVTVKDEDGNNREVTLDLPAILTLQADRAGRTAAKALGVSIGGVEVLVNNAWATDTGTAAVSVNGGNNSFTADRLRLEADNAPVLKAESGGTDVGLLAGVAVMHSNATAKSQALVTVADNNKLLADNVEAKSVIGRVGTDMIHGETHSTGVSVGINVNLNASRAITETTAKVAVGKETYKTEDTEETVAGGEHQGETVKVTKPVTNLDLSTENNASRRSVLGNFTIGAVSSIGAGDAIAEGDDKSLVEAGGGDVNNLAITAGGNGKTRGLADGDGGGLTDFGAHATVTLDTRTTNRATLSGTWNVADTAGITAEQTATSNGTSKTGAGGVLSVTWANSDNKLAMDTKTVLAKDTVLNAGRSYVQAVNHANVGPDDGETYSNHMNIGGVIQFSPNVKSDAVVDTKANIEVGENSRVTTKTGQVYDAHTELDYTNKVEGKGGGVAENIWVYSDNTITSANGITVGKNSSLKQDGGYENGDLTLSAGDDLTLDTVAEAYTGGVEGIIIAHTENNVTRNNKIKVDGGLYSGHDINLFAGADTDGAGSSVKITTGATAYNRTLFSVYTDPEVTYDLKNNQQVEVGAGGSATSVRNINITADNGTESLKKDVSKIKFFGWRDEDEDDHQVLANEPGKSNIKETNTNFVKVDGSLKTGTASKAIIEISGVALPEGLTPAEGSWQDFAVSTEGSTIAISKDAVKTGEMDYASQLGSQLAAVEKLIEDYGTGSDQEDTAAYYGYVQQRQRILEDMDKHGLYEDQIVDGKTIRVYKAGGVTVRYVEIPELLVSGGNISINADTLTGTGKLDAGGTPQIKVTNHSNAYLKLNGARVGEAGGEIFFRGTGTTLSSVAKNEDINKLNKNKDSKAAFTELHNDAASGEASAILVENDNPYIDAIKVKDAQGNTGEYHPVTNVAVTGNLTNEFGDVHIHNASGDINIGSGDTKGADIIGKTVRLTALGSISQDYVDGIVNIGGRPQDLNSAEVQKIINKSQVTDATTTEVDVGLIAKGTDITQASAGRIAGGAIYIAASDINVNGLIQSGFSKYEAEVPQDADESNIVYRQFTGPDGKPFIINATPVTVKGRTLYKVNNGGRMVYDDTIGAFKYIVQVYYDPEAQNLVMEDIDTQGGRIYLSGRISSTGNGKILAMNGGADISITNNSKYSLEAGKILNNDTEGKITITDVAQDTWTEYTPAFTKTITNYSQYAKDTAKAEEATLVTDGIGYNDGAETKGTYSVKKGQRYNWTLGSETGITKYYHQIDSTLFWGALNIDTDTSSLSKYEKSPVREKNEGKRELGSGEFIGEVSDAYKTLSLFGTGKKLNESEFGYVYENRVTSETRTVTAQWKEGGNWWALWSNPKYHLEWNTKTGTTQSTTFSLAADKDIAIGFIGSENGNIAVRNTLGESLNVKNPVDLVLTDNIQNNSAGGQVTLQADRGSVIQKGNTALTAGKVNIEAQDNIENIHITSLGSRSANPDGTYTATDAVELSARSLQGGKITVNVAGGTADGQLLPGNAVIKKLASEGKNRAGMLDDVALTAEGNIAQEGADATVRGLDVTLTSLNGGIGTAEQEIVLDTQAEPYGMNPDSAAVNASARAGIYLQEEDGDMRVGSIVSREGDVALTANSGRLLDALPETETTNNMDENDLVKRWIDAGLIAGTTEYEGAYITGLKQDAANYKARVERQMALCASGEANDDLKAEYTNADGTLKYASADEYLAGDATYQAIVDKYTNPHFVWTKEQMLYAIRNAIINKESGVTTETQKKVANVQGKNVTLVAKGVGMHSDETTTILYKDITGSSDEAIANLKLLANADAEDVTMYDTAGHILTFAVDADGRQVPVARDADGNEVETDGKVEKFVIGNMSPLGVKATGQVNITAHGDNAFIAGRSDEKGVFSPVNAGLITATGQDVRLYTQEGIYNALKGIDVNYGNIHSKNLIAYGGTKDIGASDKYLGVNLSGDLLTASADGSIYIRNMITTGDNSVLRVGSLYAGDTIALNSTQGIEMTKDAQYAQAYLNAGKQLQFNVNAQDGIVGSEEAPLRILNSGTVISLEAGSANLKGVKGLLGENTTMKLGAIQTSVDLVADSEGKLETTDNIAAGMTVKLTAKSDITLNNTVAAGTLNKAGDGTIYTGGGGILLTSQQGSISETENGALKAASVVTTSAGYVLLDNERNEFRNFEANGVERAIQDEAGNPVKAIDGSVIAYAHAGANLDAAVVDTVYGDVALRNLDEGSLTVSSDGIETRTGKKGEEGSILLQQQGNILVKGSLQADGNVKEWSVNGTVSHADDIRAGKDVEIAAAEGLALSGLDVAAGRDVSLKALDGPLQIDETVVSGRDVTLFSDGDILEVKNSRISAAWNANVTQKSGDISLVNTSIQADTGDVAVTNKNGDISVGTGSAFRAGHDVAVRNEAGATALNNLVIEAGNDAVMETGSGNARIADIDISVDRDVTVTGKGGDIRLDGDVNAGRNLDIATTGSGSLDVGQGAYAKIYAGQAISLTAEDGKVLVTNNLNPLTTGTGDFTVTTRGGEIELLGRIASAQDVIAESGTGNIIMTGAITAKQDIKGLSQGGDITVTDRAVADRDLVLRTGQDGNLTLESSKKESALKWDDITSGRDVVLVADRGDIAIDNRIIVPGDISVTTGSGAIRTTDVRASDKGKPILDAGHDIKLQTGDGPVNLGQTVESGTVLAAGNDFTVTSQRGDINIYSTVTATGNIKTETGYQGETLLKGNLDAGNNVTVEGRSGTINMHRESAISAGNDVTLRVFGGGINAQGSISAGRDATVASRIGSVILADSSAVKADRHMTAEGYTIWSYGDIDAGENVYVNSESKNVTVGGKVAAGQGVFVHSRNGNTSVYGDIEATNVAVTVEHGTLTLDGDVKSREDITAKNQDGDVVVKKNVQAGQDMVLSAQEDGRVLIELPDDEVLSAGRNITLMTENASLTVNNKLTAQTGNAYVSTTSGDVEVKNTVSAGQDVVIKTRSGDITAKETGIVPLLDAGRDVKLETVSGNIDLGSPDSTDRLVNAGRDVIAASKSGNITMQGVFTAGENAEAHNESGDIAMNVTGGSVKDVIASGQGGFISLTVAEGAAQNVNATNTGNGDVWMRETVNAAQDVSVQTENGNIQAYGDTSAGKDVALKTAGGDILQLGFITAARDINASSTSGTIGLIGVTEAGNNIYLETKTGSIGALGMATAGNEILAMTDSGIILVTGLNDEPTLSAKGDVALGSLTGDIKVEGAVKADRDVTLLNNSGNVSITGNVTASRDVDAMTDSGNIVLGGDVSANESVSAKTKTGNISYGGNVTAKKGSVTAEVTEKGNIRYGGYVDAGTGVTGTAKEGNVIYAGNVTSQSGTVAAETGNGSIDYGGNVTAKKGSVTAAVAGNGDITYMGTVISAGSGDVKASTQTGNVSYRGNVEARGGSVIVDDGIGYITYDGNVRARNDVSAVMESGVITYNGTVLANQDITATITDAGSVMYMKPVKAGRDVIADVNLGNILYNSDVTAGRNVIGRTGAGSVAYMGRVTAGKDLPEQIRYGYGKIAYYDRYGLVGYSNTFSVVPVRNATTDEIETDEIEAGQQ